MTSGDDLWLIDIAWRLDRLRWVPRPMLAKIVLNAGACMWPNAADEVPAWLDDELTDRELAARICGGCPVQDECLEWELRTAGDRTVGVWGALSDDDRRALYPYWLRRGERATSDADGRPGS
jgi:WhiB family redox-sensing transcriptional regulator